MITYVFIGKSLTVKGYRVEIFLNNNNNNNKDYRIRELSAKQKF